MIKKCSICGIDFDGSARQKRCASCRYIYPDFDNKCSICGETFKSKYAGRKYCDACRRKMKADRAKIAAQRAASEARETEALRNAQDSTRITILRMFEEGYSRNEIHIRTGISHDKIRKILVDAGILETKESVLYKQGYTMQEISEMLGVSKAVVCNRIPYEHSIYNSSAPSANAQRIRDFRKRKKS